MSFFLNILDIVKVQGVDRYILVRNDGTIAAHNVGRREDMAAKIIQAGNGALNMFTHEHFGAFRYLVLNLEDDQTLIIFWLGKFYLGLWSDRSVRSPVLIKKVKEFLTSIA